MFIEAKLKREREREGEKTITKRLLEAKHKRNKNKIR